MLGRITVLADGTILTPNSVSSQAAYERAHGGLSLATQAAVYAGQVARARALSARLAAKRQEKLQRERASKQAKAIIKAMSPELALARQNAAIEAVNAAYLASPRLASEQVADQELASMFSGLDTEVGGVKIGGAAVAVGLLLLAFWAIRRRQRGEHHG